LGLKGPDAINLWIGNSDSTTTLHKDNYENIYCQIVGSKDFVLLSPLETACVNEKFMPGATYSSSMEIVPDDPPAQVPCALWDPDKPTENTTKFSHLGRPLRVKLNPGDLFYLPATWYFVLSILRMTTSINEQRYHKVSQDSTQESICCSVNYCRLATKGEIPHHVTNDRAGYDMDFEGGFSATNAFVRKMAWAATGAEGP